MPVITPPPIALTYQQTTNLDLPVRPYPLATGMAGVVEPAGLLVAATAGQPVPEIPVGAPKAATETRTSFNDWYYRIHFIPVALDLGSVTSDQVRVLQVWNAFFESKTIESTVLVSDPSITLTSPVAPPAEILPLQSLYYQLNVSAEGPAAIEATVTWTIEGQTYVVPIEGRRRVLFSWGPNWAAQVTDTLSWATSVSRAWSGKEQRMKIARLPRRALRYTARLLRAELTQGFDSAIYGWQGRLFLVPLWQEAASTTAPLLAGASSIAVDTRGMTLESGGPLILYVNATLNEMATVLSYTDSTITLRGPLQLDWPAGAKVVPCVDGLPIGGFSTNRQVPTHVDVPVAFTANPGSGMLRSETGAVADTYRNIEAYYPETDWSNGIDIELQPNGFAVDNGMATLQPVRRGDFPEINRSFRWAMKSRVEAGQLRQFFCRRAGRFRPVWLPSGTDDFTLVDPIETVSNSIVVRANEYTGLVRMQAGRRDIVIMLRNGRRLARRIIDAQQTGDRTVLTLDSGFDEGVLPGEIKRISFLGLYRMTEDFVTFNWITDRVSVVETNFTLTEPDE